MVNDYAKPVIEHLKISTNSMDDLSNMVAIAEAAIEEIDVAIATLLSQRRDLMIIFEQTVAMSGVISGEALRDASDIARISSPPQEVAGTERVRERILYLADWFGKRNAGKVSDGAILTQLGTDKIEIPWKNPNAVIATILTRSGKWNRAEKGQYHSTEMEVTEDNDPVDDLPF